MVWMAYPVTAVQRPLPESVCRHIDATYSTDQGKGASRAAYTALTMLFAAQCGTDAGRTVLPPIAYTQEGKPSFATNEYGGLRFSLSHTGGMAFAVLSDRNEVGIDAELITPDRLASHRLLASHRFFPEEQASISRQTAGLKDGYRESEIIQRIWTRKEAIAKLTGVLPLNVNTCLDRRGTFLSEGSPAGRYTVTIAFTR